MVAMSSSLLTVPVAAGGSPIRNGIHPLPDPFPRFIAPAAYDNVREVLDSGFKTNMISRFEAALARTTGTAYAATTANCTAAVHAVIGALQYLGRLQVGDEVLVSPITDYGSVMGVVAQGCIPVFPDVDPDTGNITGATVRAALAGRSRARALIAVHFYGLLCPMDEILEAAREHDLVVIEDVCQAPLAEYRSQDGRVHRAGSMGEAGCFSFEGEKHLSADHGGAITSNDKALIEACHEFSSMRGAYMKPGYGRVHTRIGICYRWGHLEAAVALAQLGVLEQQNRRRQELAAQLEARLAHLDGLRLLRVPPGSSHMYWLFAFQLVPERFRVPLAQLAAALNAEGLPGSLAPYYLVPESHTFIADRRHAFGASAWPFSERDPADLPVYGGDSVPNAHAHISRIYRVKSRKPWESVDVWAQAIKTFRLPLALPGWDQAINALAKLLDQALAGQITVAAAVDQAKGPVNEIVRREGTA